MILNCKDTLTGHVMGVNLGLETEADGVGVGSDFETYFVASASMPDDGVDATSAGTGRTLPAPRDSIKLAPQEDACGWDPYAELEIIISSYGRYG